MSKTRCIRSFSTALILPMLLLTAGAVQAAVIEAADDAYGIPFGRPLAVESPGVLDNDTLDDEAALTSGVTAELAIGPAHGTLECPSDPGLSLCPDGSFSYTPGDTFTDSDSFTYSAVFDAATVATATVTLSACTAGPEVYVCWSETAYLAKLAELGYSLLREGFEDDAVWGGVRSPSSAPEVVSQGIAWTSNYPLTNDVSTSLGAAQTGEWGIYDPDHGFADGTTTECNVDNPPETCLYYDGVTGTQADGRVILHAVGAHFSGFSGANIDLLIDGVPYGGGKLSGLGHQFFGVIDIAGFTQFQVRETDGKVGQALLIFSDDFTIGYLPQDHVGVRRSNEFWLDVNGNGLWDGAAGGDTVFAFGTASDKHVIGDWNGDGADDVGVRRDTAFWLDANGNDVWNGTAGGDLIVGFGAAEDTPIIGDWNGDGLDDVGIYRPGVTRFFLDLNGNGLWDGTPTDGIFPFGIAGDVPIIGDWNGDGVDEIGVYRPGAARFYLDLNGNNLWDGTPTDGSIGFGTLGDTPVIGDWNGDGVDDVGVRRENKFWLDANGNDQWDGTTAGDAVFLFGASTDIPVIGKW
jgi:hypothetical protein